MLLSIALSCSCITSCLFLYLRLCLSVCLSACLCARACPCPHLFSARHHELCKLFSQFTPLEIISFVSSHHHTALSCPCLRFRSPVSFAGGGCYFHGMTGTASSSGSPTLSNNLSAQLERDRQLFQEWNKESGEGRSSPRRSPPGSSIPVRRSPRGGPAPAAGPSKTRTSPAHPKEAWNAEVVCLPLFCVCPKSRFSRTSSSPVLRFSFGTLWLLFPVRTLASLPEWRMLRS